MENMASRRRTHTETTTSEEQRKVLVCVVHFRGSAGGSFVNFFLIAKDLSIEWKNFKISAGGDV